MEYAAMTVNERLYASGKLKSFDVAVLRKDVINVIDILKSVDIDNEPIIPIIERLGFNKSSLAAYKNDNLNYAKTIFVSNFFKRLFFKN